MNHNLERLKTAGSQVTYFSCNVADFNSVEQTITQIHQNFGRIQGIIHGAGVLADKLIREKPEEQFRRVFETKVQGLKNLLKLTRKDPLKVICCFSSVASRTGNTGQVAYAMANEVLNKVSQIEKIEREKKGTPCIIKSINWGPWDGGMVSPQLKAHFESQGIALLDIKAGAVAFVDELNAPLDSAVEVVIGGSMINWAKQRPNNQCTFDLYIHQAFQPWLTDHQIKEQVVIPAMMVN